MILCLWFARKLAARIFAAPLSTTARDRWAEVQEGFQGTERAAPLQRLM